MVHLFTCGRLQQQWSKAFLLGLGLLAAPSAPLAQTLSVQSISAGPDLGKVVSAPSGATVFTIAASGLVTKSSGAGARITTGSSIATVTVACGNQILCPLAVPRIRVGGFASTSGRGQALSNFTVTDGTAQIIGTPTGSDPVDFVISPIPANGSRTFQVGFDFPIAGNDSGLNTGTATAGFYVFIAVNPFTPTSGSVAGLARATVFRPITITKQSDLVFGTLTRPASGTGVASINPADGTRTLSNLSALPGAAGISAKFNVQGEGGQAFDISGPASFVLTDPGGDTLSASLAYTASGAQVLSGALGTAGTLSLGVGANLTLTTATPSGAYSGGFSVTVSYD